MLMNPVAESKTNKNLHQIQAQHLCWCSKLLLTPEGILRYIYSWQMLGPLLKVKLLVGYILNPTKLKGAKGIRLI